MIFKELTEFATFELCLPIIVGALSAEACWFDNLTCNTEWHLLQPSYWDICWKLEILLNIIFYSFVLCMNLLCFHCICSHFFVILYNTFTSFHAWNFNAHFLFFYGHLHFQKLKIKLFVVGDVWRKLLHTVILMILTVIFPV